MDPLVEKEASTLRILEGFLLEDFHTFTFARS